MPRPPQTDGYIKIQFDDLHLLASARSSGAIAVVFPISVTTE